MDALYLHTGRLLDLDRSIAGGLLREALYPWDVLPGLKDYILKLGQVLSPESFDHPAEDIWIHKSAKVFASAFIGGPCIIDEGAEIRHCAFIRGSAIVGKHAVVGNSTELKNCVLFDSAQAPHFNYVGDSILGYKAHMGAGSILSNVKADKSLVVVKADGLRIETRLKKFGAVLGDHAELGCNCVLNPGTIIGRTASVYPTCFVRGYVPEGSIYKTGGATVRRT